MSNAPSSKTVDLHTHTDRSDGELSPAALVAAAEQIGLSAIAITDHDTLAGVAEARLAARGSDIEVVSGIEITTAFGGRELHLLGLFVDESDGVLQRICEQQHASRDERAVVMVERISRLVGRLELETVQEQAAGAPIGRPHVARAMVSRGLVESTQQAFVRYLGIGRPCHVPRRLPATPTALEAVHGAGGIAVVAHPGSSRVRDKLLTELAQAGLDGVEVRHPRHPPHRERLLLALCQRHGLLPSGGSDFHGLQPGASRLGQHRVPASWLEALRQRARDRRSEAMRKESRA